MYVCYMASIFTAGLAHSYPTASTPSTCTEFGIWMDGWMGCGSGSAYACVAQAQGMRCLQSSKHGRHSADPLCHTMTIPFAMPIQKPPYRPCAPVSPFRKPLRRMHTTPQAPFRPPVPRLWNSQPKSFLTDMLFLDIRRCTSKSSLTRNLQLAGPVAAVL